MGFEDRDYYRDRESSEGGLPGFRFDRQSVITSLIVVNVVVFLADMFFPSLQTVLALKADAGWQVWTFLTHGFAHAPINSEPGILHIVFNMLTLFFLVARLKQNWGESNS